MLPIKCTGLHAGKCSLLTAYRASCIFSGFGIRKIAFSIETWKFFLLIWVAKQLTPGFSSLPNKVEFMGIVLGKILLWLLATLGSLFFDSSCDWNSFDNPTSLCHSALGDRPASLHRHIPAVRPCFCGNGNSMQPKTSQCALGCTGGILSNLEKENLRDVDVLSFGQLLQKHRIC